MNRQRLNEKKNAERKRSGTTRKDIIHDSTKCCDSFNG